MLKIDTPKNTAAPQPEPVIRRIPGSDIMYDATPGKKVIPQDVETVRAALSKVDLILKQVDAAAVENGCVKVGSVRTVETDVVRAMLEEVQFGFSAALRAAWNEALFRVAAEVERHRGITKKDKAIVLTIIGGKVREAKDPKNTP